MALRGHPRYRAFKILPGNFALGERVAPNDKEIEAASRRKPSTNAMEHASAAHVRRRDKSVGCRVRCGVVCGAALCCVFLEEYGLNSAFGVGADGASKVLTPQSRGMNHHFLCLFVVA